MRELSDSKRVRVGRGDMIGEFEFRVLEGNSFQRMRRNPAVVAMRELYL
jgi:hypothetical protein